MSGSLNGGSRLYQSAEAQHTRAAAVASRARAVPTAYEALARDLDERCHGVCGDAVRAGVVGAGPVLRLLRSYPECVGLVFGAFGEASTVAAYRVQPCQRGAGAGSLWSLTHEESHTSARCAITLRKPAGGPRYGASHRRPAAGDRARESVCLELNSTLRSSTGTSMRREWTRGHVDTRANSTTATWVLSVAYLW